MSIVHDYGAIANAIKPTRDDDTSEYYCEKCEGGGWMQVHSLFPPQFDVCDECHNPLDIPSP